MYMSFPNELRVNVTVKKVKGFNQLSKFRQEA